MLEQQLLVQSISNAGEIFGGLIKTAMSVPFTECQVLMAYASYKGCSLINTELSNKIPHWNRVKKCWLISIDGGVTEPNALEFLSELRNSEVRIPNAQEVLQNNLHSKKRFHHKLYLFNAPSKESLAIFSGSPNLTVSGLYTNNEQATSLICRPAYDKKQQVVYKSLCKQKELFDNLFIQSDLLTSKLLRDYRAKAKQPTFNREDNNKLIEKIDEPNSVVSLNEAVSLATASYFWIEAGSGIGNWHVGNKGNQLDLQRGARVFFGFSPKFVSPNTILGDVRIIYNGGHYNGTMKFGDNKMDKLNLPPCNLFDIPTYVNKTLLFKRNSNGSFELKIGQARDIELWKRLSQEQNSSYKMRSGREFGVFRKL